MESTRDGVLDAIEKLSEGLRRRIREKLDIDEDYDKDYGRGDRPRRLSEFFRSIREGREEESITLSAFDMASVYARNPACVYPFEHDGVMHADCIAVDSSDMCRDVNGHLVFCYGIDEEIFASSSSSSAPASATNVRVQLSGDECAFPIVFEGESHDDCVPYLGSSWCTNADGAWGECL